MVLVQKVQEVWQLLASTSSGSVFPQKTDRRGVGTSVAPLRLRDEAGQFPVLLQCQIQAGADNWQSVPLHVQALGEKTGIPVTVVPGRGHLLGRGCVGGVLEGWLKA